jgi:hypothetical protein
METNTCRTSVLGAKIKNCSQDPGQDSPQGAAMVPVGSRLAGHRMVSGTLGCVMILPVDSACRSSLFV